MTPAGDLERAAAAALEALPLPVLVVDAEGRLAFVNAAAQALGGVAPLPLSPGMAWPQAASLLLAAGLLDRHTAAQPLDALAAPRPVPDAAPRPVPDAAGGPVALQAAPLPGGGHCVTLRDLRDLPPAQHAALRQAALLRDIVAHLGIGVAAFSADGRMLLGNPRYEALIGLPPGSLPAGVTQAEVLDRLVARGEVAATEAAALVAARHLARADAPFAYQRRRPDGTVVRIAGRPMPPHGHLVEVADVSALTQAEAEARRRAALLDDALSALPHGVVVYDAEGRVAMVNQAQARVMAGAAIAVGEHRADIARRLAGMGEAGADGAAPPEAEAAGPTLSQRARADGTVIEVRTAPMADGGRIEVTTDITALHQAETQARAHAALLRVMLDTMRHGISCFDAGRRLVTANALAGRLLGLPLAALRPGRTFEALVAEQVASGELDAEEGQRAIARARACAAGTPYAYRRSRPDGMVIEVSADPVPAGGFVVTYSDVTATARAEAEARDRSALLQATIDHLRQGIIVYDAERRVRVANRQAEEIAGHRRGAIVPGRTLDDIVGEMIPAGVMRPGAEAEAAIRHILSYDRSRPTTTVRGTHDGRVIEVHSDPLPDGGFIVSHIDITPLARAEGEARQRAAMLQAMLDSTRHGIALFGPDRRLRVANQLAATLSGLGAGELETGLDLDALLERQGRAGWLGPEPHATQLAERLRIMDRSRRHSAVWRRSDGRTIEVASDPTPDGGFVVSLSDITALVQAQAEASQRAAVLGAMQDNMRHGIALFDAGQRLVAANRLAATMTGLGSVDAMLGETLSTLMRRQVEIGELPDSLAEAAAMLDRLRSHRSVRERPDGTVLEVLSDPTPDGGFIMTYADVTPMMRLEAEARRRADILQVMLDNIRHGICYYGPDRRVIAANALTAEFGGHTPGLLAPGRTLDEMLADQARNGGIGPDARAVTHAALGMDRSLPHRYVRPHGDGRTIEVTSDPTPDGGFVVTMSDITPLVAAEAEAKRRAAIQQAMLDNIRHAILLVDAQGKVVAANRVFCQLLGLPEAVVAPGRPFTDFVDHLAAAGEYGGGEAGAAAAAAIRGRPRDRPIRSIRTRPDGSVLEAVSDPTPDGGWVLTFTDVTAFRRVQSELETARDAAEAANRAKSRFLATMSHELRTPLNAVIGFAEALLASPGDPMAGDFVRSIHDAGRHLLSLIDDILDVARAETSGFQVAEERVDLALVTGAATAAMRATAEAGGVVLATEVAPGLPCVRADELRLRQVLLHLLSNAVKFTAAGGRVTVTVARDAAQGGLAIRVADTGIGMREEDIPRAFEPFTQLDGAMARRFQGSGLGLYLSKALAAAQGATLALASEPGRGTVATLHFPPDRLAEAAG